MAQTPNQELAALLVALHSNERVEYSLARKAAVAISALMNERDSLRQHCAALADALRDYMSQFGQGLAAHGIEHGPAQKDADGRARTALDAWDSSAPSVVAKHNPPTT